MAIQRSLKYLNSLRVGCVLIHTCLKPIKMECAKIQIIVDHLIYRILNITKGVLYRCQFIKFKSVDLVGQEFNQQNLQCEEF